MALFNKVLKNKTSNNNILPEEEEYFNSPAPDTARTQASPQNSPFPPKRRKIPKKENQFNLDQIENADGSFSKNYVGKIKAPLPFQWETMYPSSEYDSKYPFNEWDVKATVVSGDLPPEKKRQDMDTRFFHSVFADKAMERLVESPSETSKRREAPKGIPKPPRPQELGMGDWTNWTKDRKSEWRQQVADYEGWMKKYDTRKLVKEGGDYVLR